MISLTEYKPIGEKYYETVIDGLRVIIAPKNFSTKYASLTVDFGSADLRCEKNGEERELIPGTAHFLEHKMFEDENGDDAFEHFSANGASANAYTSATKTCYMFSCAENFEDNLRLLLKTVSTPHFTDDSVEKEKSIIRQEIRMYRDDPYWRMSFSLLEALYQSDPIRLDPAGTEQSVSLISKEALYEAYDLFYTAPNMLLCICGDVDPDYAVSLVKDCVKPKNTPPASLVRRGEPEGICKERTVTHMDVASPLFAVGIKCGEAERGASSARLCAEHEIILQLVFGRSGAFYNGCYETGLTGDRFSAGYSLFRRASYVMICGSSPDPEKMYALIAAEIERRKNGLCTEAEFERAKRVCYSSAIEAFSRASGTASALSSFAFEGEDMFEYIEMLRGARLEDVEKRFTSDYRTDRMALSVIYDKEEKK